MAFPSSHSIENEARRRHRGQSCAEREQARRARQLVEGLEELWDTESSTDSEQSLSRALHEVIDPP